MLDLVRDGDEPGLDSRPGLRSLSDLVDHFRAAGLTVDLEVTGEPRPLPATADLCAYRVLQEALTNTLKHAGRVRARVSIRYYANGVDLEVHDGGPAPGSAPGAGPGAGPGHGLTGMRERVELLGGELSTGPHGRGFSVRARLPLGTGPP